MTPPTTRPTRGIRLPVRVEPYPDRRGPNDHALVDADGWCIADGSQTSLGALEAALNATATPAPDYAYDGDAYIRPMGRGVTLNDAPGENGLADYLEDAVGAYQRVRLQVQAWKKDGTP